MKNIDLQKVVDCTFKNGGYTSEELKGFRFIVSKSIATEIKIKKNNFNIKTLKDALSSYKFKKGDGWGTWLNNDDDYIYIDLNLGYNDEKTAKTVAIKNHQLAYYDAINGESIKTGINR